MNCAANLRALPGIDVETRFESEPERNHQFEWRVAKTIELFRQGYSVCLRSTSGATNLGCLCNTEKAATEFEFYQPWSKQGRLGRWITKTVGSADVIPERAINHRSRRMMCLWLFLSFSESANLKSFPSTEKEHFTVWNWIMKWLISAPTCTTR